MAGVEAGIVDGFIRNVFILRDQDVADTVSLREGDLEVLATATGRRVQEFLRRSNRPSPPIMSREAEPPGSRRQDASARLDQRSPSGTRRSDGISSSMSPYARTSSLLHDSCRTFHPTTSLAPSTIRRSAGSASPVRVGEGSGRRELVGPFEQLSGQPFHLVFGQIPVIDV